MTDPISDLIVRIKNAQRVGKKTVVFPYSKMKEGVTRILKDEGFILDFQKTVDAKKFPQLEVDLKYDEAKRGIIRDMHRVSRPGRRVYKRISEIRSVKFSQGIAILSTPKGLKTDIDAKKLRLGGEVILEVY